MANSKLTLHLDNDSPGPFFFAEDDQSEGTSDYHVRDIDSVEDGEGGYLSNVRTGRLLPSPNYQDGEEIILKFARERDQEMREGL